MIVSPDEFNDHLRAAIVVPIPLEAGLPLARTCRFQRRNGFVALDQ
jgi:mRNA-degrading endonuclease toxin of MazEF toxin-antitoxin module